MSYSLFLWLPTLPPAISPRHDSTQINTQPVSSLKNTRTLFFNHKGLFHVKAPEVCPFGTALLHKTDVPAPHHSTARSGAGIAEGGSVGQGLCVAPPRGNQTLRCFPKSNVSVTERTERVWLEVVEGSVLGFLVRRNQGWSKFISGGSRLHGEIAGSRSSRSQAKAFLPEGRPVQPHRCRSAARAPAQRFPRGADPRQIHVSGPSLQAQPAPLARLFVRR